MNLIIKGQLEIRQEMMVRLRENCNRFKEIIMLFREWASCMRLSVKKEVNE